MSRVTEVERELVRIFKGSCTKHEANVRARPILEQASRDPGFLRDAIAGYLETPGSLDRKNYPVVAIPISLNPWFGLGINCWIPLPDKRTNLSTKAIHHHGDMLLSTVTLHGAGYEHWLFTLPKELDAQKNVWSMNLLEVAPHPQHHVAFVDAWTAHTPFYPREVSLTLALWSSQKPTTWKDRLKRLPLVRGNEARLRDAAKKLGLTRRLDIKVVENFDYYPAADGFRVMHDRKEFELGPNADHVASVFCVMQCTGNDSLAPVVKKAIDRGLVTTGKAPVLSLLESLERGKPIEGRLSDFHHDRADANFTREAVHAALAALEARAKGNDETTKQQPHVAAE